MTSPSAPKPSELTEAVIQRFNTSITKRNTCWLWTGTCNSDGYGYLVISGRLVFAHRFSHVLYKGDIPDGYHIDHLCRVRNCVNPGHLEAVTPAENNRRGFSIPAINARKTHCVNGHEFTPENTKRVEGNKRHCRECNVTATRKARAKYPTKPLTREQKDRRNELQRLRRASGKGGAA